MGQGRIDALAQVSGRCRDQDRFSQAERRDEAAFRLRANASGIHLPFTQRHEAAAATWQLAAAKLTALRQNPRSLSGFVDRHLPGSRWPGLSSEQPKNDLRLRPRAGNLESPSLRAPLPVNPADKADRVF